ncbi:MAG: ribosomal RNA small subunit methyltransferase A [Deltaproteobacteria bacterium]|nr:ribosomal RNA small subunit methyltransferase A [Deltaproteobacteria bacterium]
MQNAETKHVVDILRRAGLAAKKRFSQSFLIDAGAAREIVGAVPDAARVIVEIGAGTGALTGLLAEAGRRVVAIEIDRGLAAHLRQAFRGRTEIEIVEADALKFDFRAAASDGPMAVVGNLPYAITTPLLECVLEAMPPIAGAVIMVQREVAARMIAGPGSKTYGALSLFVQSYVTVERVLELSPRAFFPRPNVASTVLRLAPVASPVVSPELRTAFRAVVRDAFNHRRKMLRNTFAPEQLVDAGIDGTRRAETLSVADFVRLARATPGP